MDFFTSPTQILTAKTDGLVTFVISAMIKFTLCNFKACYTVILTMDTATGLVLDAACVAGTIIKLNVQRKRKQKCRRDSLSAVLALTNS